MLYLLLLTYRNQLATSTQRLRIMATDACPAIVRDLEIRHHARIEREIASIETLIGMIENKAIAA